MTRVLLSTLLLLQLLTLPVSAATKIKAFGDSVTEAKEPFEADSLGGYPKRLEKKLDSAGEAATVQNWGLRGEATVEGISRINQALAGGGDIMLLMEGTNDIHRGYSLETTVFNMKEMARRSKAAGFEAILASLIPRPPWANRDRTNTLTGAFAEMLRVVAHDNGYRFVDPYEVFLYTEDIFAEYYYTAGRDDVGHPNSQGFELLAQTFFDVVQDIDTVPPVSGGLTPHAFTAGVKSDATVRATLLDFGEGIDINETALLINDTEVNARINGDGEMVRINYNDPGGFCGVVRVAARSQDLASPPNTRTRQLGQFEVVGSETFRVDVDKNCRVDGFDLAEFAYFFGAVSSERRYNEKYDFDSDGDIDGEDLARLARRFGDSSA